MRTAPVAPPLARPLAVSPADKGVSPAAIVAAALALALLFLAFRIVSVFS